MSRNTRPRIGIDLAATAAQKSGLGWYEARLLEAMHAIETPLEFVEFNTIKKNLRTPQRIAWDQIGVPLTAYAKRVNGLFVPAFSAPHIMKPMVMTAHDIYGVLYPEQFSRLARWYWANLLPNSMKRAKHLVCISEHTKRDIMEHLHIPEDRITVTPLAAGTAFRVVHDTPWIETRLRELNVTSPFILSVGTREPRKNYARLLEAFAYASRQNVKLVIVGKEGWRTEDIQEKMQRYHLQGSVQFIDYCTEDQLVALYNACVFFVMPSLYEGFGLPALEAMACGSPVLVSQNSSLPEVVGEAGMVFNPYDVAEMRERINLLLGDTQRRNDMQQLSVDRAKLFSWEATARKTLSVLEQTFL
jgi:glycosyltransferase involved in cell wall biosynthesis